jgi:hypothetical protein
MFKRHTPRCLVGRAATTLPVWYGDQPVRRREESRSTTTAGFRPLSVTVWQQWYVQRRRGGPCGDGGESYSNDGRAPASLRTVWQQWYVRRRSGTVRRRWKSRSATTAGLRPLSVLYGNSGTFSDVGWCGRSVQRRWPCGDGGVAGLELLAGPPLSAVKTAAAGKVLHFRRWGSGSGAKRGVCTTMAYLGCQPRHASL